MKLIVGLGNPGGKFAETRHNIGFMVLMQLSQCWSIPFKSTVCRSKVGQGIFDNRAVRLALPQTMMNASGESVGCLMKRWKVEPSSTLIVCDDVSLPLGSVRIRGKGSSGGHRGLSSALEAAQTDELPRLRVGIQGQKVPEDLTAYVLGRFGSLQKQALDEALSLAVAAAATWVSSGVMAAMNRFNRRVECRAQPESMKRS